MGAIAVRLIGPSSSWMGVYFLQFVRPSAVSATRKAHCSSCSTACGSWGRNPNPGVQEICDTVRALSRSGQDREDQKAHEIQERSGDIARRDHRVRWGDSCQTIDVLDDRHNADLPWRRCPGETTSSLMSNH